MAERNRPLNVVIEIRVSEDVLLERLAVRGRQDDDHEIIRLRLKQYAKLTYPLIDYYEQFDLHKVIDGIGTADEVFDRLQRIVDSIECTKDR